MTNKFLNQLEKGARKAGMIQGKVLVGVSGGPDSVALLRGLSELRQFLQIELRAAHLDHQLRGEESAQDARWVEQFCEQLGIPLTSEKIDICGYAESKRIGIEAGARQARYQFLRKTASQENCGLIALAHHADDQVETVLHHFLRGTGLRGLAGMKWRRKLDDGLWLVRPMLEMRQHEIEASLARWQQESREDSTNLETHYTRNRLRHELIPLLEDSFNGQVSDAILSLSRQAFESQEFIREAAEKALDVAAIEQTRQACRISKTAFAGVPRHLIREAFVELWRRHDWPRQQMNFTQWDRLAGIVLGEAEGGTFPGPIDVKRVRKELHLSYRGRADS
ncbi:tRNA(Ile)-lysidine synthase [Polystyrenella longa]|uniref:tRNA(Ile)-lysidine synthase n=1 Tax=Polystyrenella longa TaxID=2528007 RepID=A0A518CQ50_9PLAN|nr:tRNA lysidine(34) synthetase TilS [Polystyrenella longa]QDU81346.1 tRNA(Ile)-lysidine synthase [Polystyrenella longa]